MTEWSKHVHRFAKKHNMTYKQANVSRKCKEAYKKRKTSPKKMSPRRRRMNGPDEDDEKKTGKRYKKELAKRANQKFIESDFYNGVMNPQLFETLKQYYKAEGLKEDEAQAIVTYMRQGTRDRS